MKIYDRIFAGMYYISGKTNIDKQPTMFSAWIMLSGVQCLNIFSVNLLVLYFSGRAIFSGRWQYFAVSALLLIVNAIYVGMRGAGVVSSMRDGDGFREVFFYCLGSFIVIFIVMALMFFRVSSGA